MRFEEMTTDDIRQIGPLCDTIVVAVGGPSYRPSHLPVGATWYVLRRLRDFLEDQLSGRILTLPVLNIDTLDDDDAITKIPDEAFATMIRSMMTELTRHISVKYIVVIIESLHKEQVMKAALSDHLKAGVHVLFFIWWRDGLQDLHVSHVPSSEVETSLVAAIAPRLVDMDQKSVQKYGATLASSTHGQQYWAIVEQILKSRVEEQWRKQGFSLN